MLCEMGDVAGAEQSILLLYRLDTSEGRGTTAREENISSSLSENI